MQHCYAIHKQRFFHDVWLAGESHKSLPAETGISPSRRRVTRVNNDTPALASPEMLRPVEGPELKGLNLDYRNLLCGGRLRHFRLGCLTVENLPSISNVELLYVFFDPHFLSCKSTFKKSCVSRLWNLPS